MANPNNTEEFVKMPPDEDLPPPHASSTPGLASVSRSEVIQQTMQSAMKLTSPPETETRSLQRTRNSADEKHHENFHKRFRGKWAFHHVRRVYLPKRLEEDPETLVQGYVEAVDWDDPKGEVVKTKDGKYVYRNRFHQVEQKYKDTAVYLSPTRAVPRRLVVQATGTVLKRAKDSDETGDWIRTRIEGNVPVVLKVSEWALGPLKKGRWWNTLDAMWRVLLVSVPLQVMLAFPSVADWDDGLMADGYTDYPGYYWDWPKYAINVLDEAPGTDGLLRRTAPHVLDVRGRSIRPHKIVLKKENNDWQLVDAKDYPSVRYIFISYSWVGVPLEKAARMAKAIAEKKGYKAYWLDKQCIHQEYGLEKDYDVYTMCDIVRSSGLVAILLGENTEQARSDWGSRLWTLPEGLLAPGDSVVWCHEDSDGVLHHDEVNKVEMTSTFWGEANDASNEGGSPIRTLAEHFSNVLTLSRLELLPSIINALAAKGWTNKNARHSDLAYAVMGFLHYRLERNEDDTLFQSLARLSFSNDSDRIIERMVCILPKQDPANPPGRDGMDNSDLFRGLSEEDQFHTRVHDITPLCDIVGVAHEDNTVIVDNCKAVHIRWKNFPRPVVQRRQGMRKMLATFFVAAGLWWLLWGFDLAITWVPFWAVFPSNGDQTDSSDYQNKILALVIAGFVSVAVLLSLAGPFSAQSLFGGTVEKSSPNLVAFEGVMPISEVEKVVFGNFEGRLTYAPSSTPFCALQNARHRRERLGMEPNWISHPEINECLDGVVPKGHHLFTLVDMGDLSVSIMSAERPPTVALLCGREGGMVRAVLCSWSFENDCLYKETVVRMPSTVYESAKPKDWLKLCLQTQDQVKRKRRETRPEQMATP